MNTIRQTDGVWKCVLCGDPSPDQSQPHLGQCRCDTGRGLGDMVADALASVGITKERAKAMANAVGIKDCGCGKRQKTWNEAGWRLGIGTPPPQGK